MLDLIVKIANFSGIISTIIVSIGFIMCIKNFKGFNFKKNTVSDCCKSIKNGLFFEVLLAVFGILEVIFSLAIISKFSLTDKPYLLIILILSGIATILAAIFPNKKHKRIHEIFGYMIFIILFIWAILLDYYLIGIDRFVGLVGGIISTVMAGGTILLYFIYKKCSIPELFFIAFVMIWNIYFSYVLLKY